MEVSACLVCDERVVGVFSEAPHCLHGMLLQSVGLTDSTQASCDASVDNWVNVKLLIPRLLPSRSSCTIKWK